MPQGIHRRRHLRVTLPRNVWGSLGDERGEHEVQVVNLSPGGAMVEYTERLALGEFHVLSLRLRGLDLRLSGHVVWGHLHRREVTPPSG